MSSQAKNKGKGVTETCSRTMIMQVINSGMECRMNEYSTSGHGWAFREVNNNGVNLLALKNIIPHNTIILYHICIIYMYIYIDVMTYMYIYIIFISTMKYERKTGKKSGVRYTRVIYTDSHKYEGFSPTTFEANDSG